MSRPPPRRPPRGCLALGAGLALLLGLLALNPLLALQLVQAPYLQASSPDGSYELIVTSGDAWLFGPHPLTAFGRARPLGLPWPLVAFEIANDGRALPPGLCSVTWPGPSLALLTCDGAEQAPASYLLDLAGGRLLARDE